MGIGKLAAPFSQSTLFFLNRNSMPPVSSLTAEAFSPCSASKSSSTLPVFTPNLASVPPARFLEQLRAMQQGLGRNAADIEASPAQSLARLGAGDFQPKLRRANRRDIAAGAGTDDEEVVVVFGHYLAQ